MNNSVAESLRNRLGQHAGLPPCCWSFALTSTCHLLSVEFVDGESAWYNKHGGKSIPLGAYAHVKPSPRRDDTHKFAPRSMRNVFVGYARAECCKMLVWELDKFPTDHGLQIRTNELAKTPHSG